MLAETTELLSPTPLDRYVQGKASCGPLREADSSSIRVQERHGTAAENRKDETRQSGTGTNVDARSSGGEMGKESGALEQVAGDQSVRFSRAEESVGYRLPGEDIVEIHQGIDDLRALGEAQAEEPLPQLRFTCYHTV